MPLRLKCGALQRAGLWLQAPESGNGIPALFLKIWGTGKFQNFSFALPMTVTLESKDFV